MRSKIFMLACAAMLATTMPAQAVLTLEFWNGVQNFTPTTGGSPSSLLGLRNYNLTSNTNLTSLNILPGASQILRVVLRDHDAGSGFTLDAFGLQTFTARIGFVPGQLDAFRDAAANNAAPTVTVWSGGGPANGTLTNPGSSIENAPYAIADFNATSFAIGNVIFPVFSGQDPGGTGVDNYYCLANFIVTAGPSGAGNLLMFKPTTNPPNFGSTDPGNGNATVSYDSEVWGAGGNSTYILPFNVVPEPSSMVLAGLAFSGLGLRLRRKFWSKTTAA